MLSFCCCFDTFRISSTNSKCTWAYYSEYDQHELHRHCWGDSRAVLRCRQPGNQNSKATLLSSPLPPSSLTIHGVIFSIITNTYRWIIIVSLNEIRLKWTKWDSNTSWFSPLLINFWWCLISNNNYEHSAQYLIVIFNLN